MATAPSGSGASASSDDEAVTLIALCDARSVAERDGDVAEAFAIAHGPLHDIARDLQDRDERTVAADLLEAKQRVEAAVENDSPPNDLPDRLSRLIEATRTSLDVLGVSAPGCS